MRKYLFSGAILGSLFSAIGLTRSTIAGPRNARLALLWVSWLASAVVAVLAVREASDERLGDYDRG